MHGNLSILGRTVGRTVSAALLITLILGSSAACASRPRGVGEGDSAHDSFTQEGLASYYHDSLHGNPTASGEPYDKNALSAAHRTLPLGTRILVENLENGRSIELRINDRGPFIEGRIVDLSRRAAESLDMIRDGVVRVRLSVAN